MTSADSMCNKIPVSSRRVTRALYHVMIEKGKRGDMDIALQYNILKIKTKEKNKDTKTYPLSFTICSKALTYCSTSFAP